MSLAEDMIGCEIGKILLQFLDNTQIEYKEIVNQKSYYALQKIRSILENDSLSDFECVEQIILVFEDMGSNCGNRHDF